MLERIDLRTRIVSLLGALILITLCGGLASVWHTYRMQTVFHNVVNTTLPALRASAELEKVLIMQKGYVTYYFQDGDPYWLKQLRRHEKEFSERLEVARAWAETPKEKALLHAVESKYEALKPERDRVIALYRTGDPQSGARLQKQVRSDFFEVIELCGAFRNAQEQTLQATGRKNLARAKRVGRAALVALIVVMVLGAFLAYTLIRHIPEPIHRLAVHAAGPTGKPDLRSEVQALGDRFEDLMKDVRQTRKKLEWSREHLLQAEKWALVGKLAAGVAHSVRNPMTSIKMRLFSLERSLEMNDGQKEDFEVISEEIRQVDSIVNNFLEFSRPPKLQLRAASPSDATDTAVLLLRHRLESNSVSVRIDREERLPEIRMDPDALKEAVVNLLINACDAMVFGGKINLEEKIGSSPETGPVVTIGVSDNGPGVPEDIREKIFQPFFSSKPEGNGLGLNIANRIVEEHGGWMELRSNEHGGATFLINLPKEEG